MDKWTPKYDHKGRWKANQKSLFDTGKDITWPQYMAECVIFWRSKLIKTFPKFTKGPGWSKAFGRQLASLNQQCYCIANYFPHPEDEPLVIPATKNVIRSLRITKIGSLKKDRSKVTKEEKYFVGAIEAELNRLIKERDKFSKAVMTDELIKQFCPEKKPTKTKKSKMDALKEMENG